MNISYVPHGYWLFTPWCRLLKYQKPSFGDSTSTYIKPETQNHSLDISSSFLEHRKRTVLHHDVYKKQEIMLIDGMMESK